MDAIQNLNPGTSNEAKLALAALLGSTMAQLKEIDKSIVGSSSNISSKLNVGQILQSIPQAAPQAQPPVLQHQVVQQPAPALSFAPQATVVNAGLNISAPQQIQPTTEEDPNQLVFDFNKPITPETVNSKLDAIVDKLDRVLELLKKS